MSRPTREVTGRTVLIWLLSFFGLVLAVNGVMIKVAASTFGGVEVASSYKAGLKFGQDLAESRAQDALHWQVTGTIGRDRNADALLEVSARDQNGVALAGLAGQARLIHPADSRRDVKIDLHEVAAGSFRGVSAAAAGQWALEIALERGDERVFMSRSRIILR